MRNSRICIPAALALLLTLAACDRNTVIRNSITFNNDLMTVSVYAKVDGKVKKDYSREVNVAGISTTDRGPLGQKILDSLQALPEK